MEKRYKVVFVYADGHIEEIDDVFTSGKDALEFGNNMLAQVASTEKFMGRSHDDVFGDNAIEPYFMIIELNNKKYHMVYDSRFAR